MKKTLLFAFALIAVGCGPEGRDVAELARKREGWIYHPSTNTLSTVEYSIMRSARFRYQYLDIETFEPYTGPVFGYPAVGDGPVEPCDGQYWVGNLENGFLHGQRTYYFPCLGDMRRVTTWVEGLRHGLLEAYGEDGRIEGRGYFVRGSQCGDWMDNGQYESYPSCPPDLEGGN